MRIAQIAPLIESVPPRLYGGTERVVSHLTEELVRQRHDVTLFASGDSVTRATLVAACPRSLRLDEHCVDPLAHELVALEEVFRRAHQFDILHFHVDYLHYPRTRSERIPNVTTLHGRLDIPDLQAVYHEFPEMPLISISRAQREPLPWANWQGNVHHGIPEDLLRFDPRGGDSLIFLGRISHEKRPDRAIAIARAAGMPLRIAAKVDAADREYHANLIAPMIEREGVEYLGEVADRDKGALLGGARALLFPIDWPEPFGLVMIEAMACGTPVIAWNRGSVPEVVDHGVTGYVVNGIREAVEAVHAAGRLDRHAVRRRFEERFTVTRMARDYLEIYRRLATEEAESLAAS